MLYELYTWMIMEGLEIKDIWKSFEDTAVLKGISFSLAKGEILGILGPSGSGKTTLLEIIAGLIEPDRGDCLWNGNSLLGIPTHQRNFGLMFQEYVLFPHKNVKDNVAFGLKMSQTDPKTITHRIEQVLDLVGLPDFQDRDVSTLSGGEQQRVALARSLAPEPRLVMLDEPLGALDRTIRARLVGDLREILKKAAQTAIYVTHDQEEAFSISDQVVILESGKAAQIGSPRDIYFHPNSKYVAQFLGMNNFINGDAVQNQEGTLLKTELGSWQIQENYQGKGVILIRPEIGQLFQSPKQSQVILRGKLINSTFSGSTIQFMIDVGGQQLSFTSSNSKMDLPQIGRIIEIVINPDDSLHFFPE
jgi:ABC-type Fe3+/spermidine/putrescine transport system ATPase subunit